MRVPILKLRNYLIVAIQSEMDDTTVIQFKEDLLNKIHEIGAKGVVIDLTSVETIDSFIAKVLGDVSEMAALMGSKVVLAGIQPAVAMTLHDLGIQWKDVSTALDLERGLIQLHQEMGE